MPYDELKKSIRTLYAPALALRRIYPYETRQKFGRFALLVTLVLFMLTLFTQAVSYAPVGNLPGVNLIGHVSGKVGGIFLILFALTFILQAIEAFHRSYYFRGLEQVLAESPNPPVLPTSWEVATIVFETPHDDVTGGFLASEYGQEILFRAGVNEQAYTDFLSARKAKLATKDCLLERDRGVTLSTYAKSIVKQDQEFKGFLAHQNISETDLVYAAQWVTRIEIKWRRHQRWWSRDNLGRIPGLGKNFSYGETYLLERYGHDLVDDHVWEASAMAGRIEDDEVEAMEQVLARARQSNVLLISEDITTARQSVALLYRKIRSGVILPPLEGKRVFLVDFEAVAMHTGEKAAYEEEVVRVMDQAVAAGHVIVYIEQLVAAIASATTIGADLVELLSTYFDSDVIQIIASSDRENYHAHVSRDTRLMQAFDTVEMHTVNEGALIEILEQRAVMREKQSGIVFTVPALHTIARLADRYFPTGVMPDKAFDLLEELVPMALAHGTTQVLQADVEKLVYEKTGVPMGDPTEAERQKLLSLEDFLHQRVVGQEAAVNAVARALRRARTGVGSAKRPMGSFLFLGPTGVGKTETAKALAEALFGNERMMNRLDMSEFQGDTALEELVGSFDMGTPGRLANMLREQQYGVLLLDEFEKSNRGVHDLFLQVLDEGEFTDAFGKRVNARNVIIIATSNAGADLIWQWEKDGKDVAAMKRDLVDHIISKGYYRPEFLNRFDDIIVFQPLKEDEVHQIARIHLNNLAKRLSEERNISLTVTDELVDRVAQKGYDPQFGGRPLVRAIKDEVEQVIADSMLRGTLRSGDTFTYHREEAPEPERVAEPY